MSESALEGCFWNDSRSMGVDLPSRIRSVLVIKAEALLSSDLFRMAMGLRWRMRSSLYCASHIQWFRLSDPFQCVPFSSSRSSRVRPVTSLFRT